MKHGITGIRLARAAIVSALLFAAALNAEVYRWTDENGVTHFSQTPPPSGDEAVVEDLPANAEGAGIDFDSGQAAVADGTDGLSAAEQVRQDIANKSDRRRAEIAALRAQCNETRSRLARLEPNRRVYYTNDEGETVRMDDEARAAEVQQLHDFLAQNCP